ncbi:MAG TPA: T9SS type A sorting domain-containing protein [Bacteroidales bacterium]|nr:T9SS type A sorting domain-containing protein [Bacteroidales bacterium]
MTNATVDQLVVDSGATVVQSGQVTVADGTGQDLMIAGSWEIASGNLVGPGSIMVEGSMLWTGGSIGGPLYMSAAKVVVNIDSSASLILSGSGDKVLDHGEIVNYGLTQWNGGAFRLHGSQGTDTTRFINAGAFTIGAGGMDLYGQSNTWFINQNNGTMLKSSPGINITSTGTKLVNRGLLRVTDGTFSTNNQNSSFHNYGTIQTLGSGVFQAAWNVNLYGGSLITGDGSFSAIGTIQLHGPVTLDTGSVLSLSAGNIVNAGPLQVKGTLDWTGGSIGGPLYMSAAKVVVNIDSSASLILSGSGDKVLDHGEIVNYGLTQWNGGAFRLHGSQGTDTTRFINAGAFTIGAGGMDLYGQSNTWFINQNNGTMLKSSPGINITSTGTKLVNRGLLRVTDGTFSTNNQNGSFHNYGTIQILGSGVFQAAWNVNLYGGSLITGNGNFVVNGNLNLHGLVILDSGSVFQQTGGRTAGTGPLLVQGTLDWAGGEIGDYFSDYTKVIIDSGASLSINGNSDRVINKALLSNYGSILWNSGVLRIHYTVGNDTSMLWNAGEFRVLGNAPEIYGQGGTRLVNAAGGTMLRDGIGVFSVSPGFEFLNQGRIEGHGDLQVNANFINQGTLAPGLGVGAMAFNGQQALPPSGTLEVELSDGSGPGLGHDLLERSGNFMLSGGLKVDESATMPNGTYTIIRLTTGQVSGSFDTLDMPSWYSLGTTDTTVFLFRDRKVYATINASVCSPDTFPFNGQDLDSTGTYTAVFTSMAGYDSIVTLHLNVLLPTTSTITAVSCEHYVSPSGKVFSQSGSYQDTLVNHAGCDSLIFIDLTIPKPDTTVIIGQGMLSAQAMGAAYQWQDCSSGLPVTGATQQSFTPSSSGSYALVITQNGCSDTSSCRSVVLEADWPWEDEFRVYPVPVEDELTIVFRDPVHHLNLGIYDLAGRHVLDQAVVDREELVLDLRHLAAGVYHLRMESDKIQAVVRILRY